VCCLLDRVVTALPREVALRHDGSLGFEPVAELRALRVGPSEVSKTAIGLKCGDQVPIGDLGHSFEVRASFTNAKAGASGGDAAAAAAGLSFGVSVLASASGEEATAIGVSGDGAQFYVDKTRSTLRNSTPPVFRDLMTAPLPAARLAAATDVASTTNLTVFVDGRVVEAFVEGRVISTLVYPSRNSSTELRLFMRCDAGATGAGGGSSVTASVRAWSLRGITVAQHKTDDELTTGARRTDSGDSTHNAPQQIAGLVSCLSSPMTGAGATSARMVPQAISRSLRTNTRTPTLDA
jgi:hypothetical protein